MIMTLFYTFFYSDTVSSPSGNETAIQGNFTEFEYVKGYTKSEIIGLGESFSKLSWQEIAGFGFKNDYDVDIFRIKYYTLHPKKGTVLSSGLIMIPKSADKKSFPLLSLQHGTVVRKSDAPSSRLNSAEVKTAVLFCAEGFIVLMADYIGMESFTGIMHPYCQSDALAYSVIDLVRAFRRIEKDRMDVKNDEGYFLMGYSEGGYATMSAAKKMSEKYPEEFKITACSPMAGPFDLSETMLEIMLSYNTYPSPYYLPYVLLGYREVYDFYSNPNEIFKNPYDKTIPPLFNGKHSGREISDSMCNSGIPRNTLNEDFIKEIKSKKGILYEALRKNDLYDWKPEFPIKLIHSVSDDQVPYENSVKAYNRFIENGAKFVTLVPILGEKKHTESAYVAIPIANLWFLEFLKEKTE